MEVWLEVRAIRGRRGGGRGITTVTGNENERDKGDGVVAGSEEIAA